LVYVTDYSKLQRHTGWKPQLNLRQTLELLREFWEENQMLLAGGAVHAPLETLVAASGNSERAA
jgi:dTDP-D-glucose 4,6-dehydratase